MCELSKSFYRCYCPFLKREILTTSSSDHSEFSAGRPLRWPPRGFWVVVGLAYRWWELYGRILHFLFLSNSLSRYLNLHFLPCIVILNTSVFTDKIQTICFITCAVSHIVVSLAVVHGSSPPPWLFTWLFREFDCQKSSVYRTLYVVTCVFYHIDFFK